MAPGAGDMGVVEVTVDCSGGGDYTRVQEALDTAPEGIALRVRIRAGVYREHVCVGAHVASVHICGVQEGGGVVLRGSGRGHGDVAVLRIATGAVCTLEALTVRAGEDTAGALQCDSGSRVRVLACDLTCAARGTRQACVDVASGAACHLTTSALHHSACSGVRVGGTVELEECNVFHIAHDCVHVLADGVCTLRRSMLYKARLSGLHVGERARVEAESCSVYHCEGPQVLVEPGSAPVLRKCKVHDGATIGMLLLGGGWLEESEVCMHARSNIELHASAANPTISRCHIHSSRQVGVFFKEGSQGVLDHNSIYANRLAGVAVEQGASPTLRRNSIYNGKHAGITVYDGGAGYYVENDVFGNALANVEISTGAEPVIMFNRIHDGLSYGVLVCAGGLGTLEQNEIAGNKLANVAVETGSNPRCVLNHIHHAHAQGVLVMEGGKGTFEQNNVHSNTASGVEVERGGNPFFRANVIYQHAHVGVIVRDGAQGIFDGNEVLQNGTGSFLIEEAAMVQLHKNVTQGATARAPMRRYEEDKGATSPLATSPSRASPATSPAVSRGSSSRSLLSVSPGKVDPNHLHLPLDAVTATHAHAHPRAPAEVSPRLRISPRRPLHEASPPVGSLLAAAHTDDHLFARSPSPAHVWDTAGASDVLPEAMGASAAAAAAAEAATAATSGGGSSTPLSPRTRAPSPHHKALLAVAEVSETATHTRGHAATTPTTGGGECALGPYLTTVYGCGHATYGELGLGELTEEAPDTIEQPTRVDAFDPLVVIDAALGNFFSVVVCSQGRVHTMGYGEHGQLGLGMDVSRVRVPTPLPALDDVMVQCVSCGTAHACVVSTGGHIYTWGNGLHGRLGHGDELTVHTPKQVAFFTGTRAAVVQTSCGDNHMGAVTDTGQLYMWGAASNGQLGLGEGVTKSSWLSTKKAVTHVTEPTLVDPIRKHEAVHVSCGARHTAVLMADGKVFTMGTGTSGQLGQGDEKERHAPTLVKALHNVFVKDVTCGGSHTVCVSVTGTVWAWGAGSSGQLGVANDLGSNVPVQVHGIRGARQVDGGLEYTAVVIDSGDLVVFGAGHTGQLGVPTVDGSTRHRLPQAVESGLTGSVMRVACGNNHTLIVTDSALDPHGFAAERALALLRAQRQFVGHLMHMYYDYMLPLLDVYSIIPSKHTVAIFGNLEQLLRVHQRILVDINARVNAWPSCAPWSEVFLTHIDGLQEHVTHAQSFALASFIVSESRRASKQFARFVNSVRARYFDDLESTVLPEGVTLEQVDLRELLVLPIRQADFLQHGAQHTDDPDMYDALHALKELYAAVTETRAAGELKLRHEVHGHGGIERALVRTEREVEQERERRRKEEKERVKARKKEEKEARKRAEEEEKKRRKEEAAEDKRRKEEEEKEREREKEADDDAVEMKPLGTDEDTGSDTTTTTTTTAVATTTTPTAGSEGDASGLVREGELQELLLQRRTAASGGAGSHSPRMPISRTRTFQLYSTVLVCVGTDTVLYEFPLDMTWVQDVPDSKTMKHAFQLTSPEASCTAAAASAQDKEAWLRDVRACVDALLGEPVDGDGGDEGRASRAAKSAAEYNGDEHMIRFRRFQYTNGSVYVGEFLLGQRHGTGTYTFPGGHTVYTGEWAHDLKQGFGQLSNASTGENYVGDLFQDKAHGTGTFKYSSGDRYTGEWRSSYRHGRGEMEYANGDVYVGDWISDKQEGYGVWRGAGGEEYRGHWIAGEKNGWGEWTYADGSRYDGNFHQGKRHGRGVYTHGELKYDGDWVEDVQDGVGVQVDAGSGDTYKGHWRSGVKHGTGLLTSSDGTKFQGDFVDGMRRGKGIMMLPSGDRIIGEWNEDVTGNGLLITRAMYKKKSELVRSDRWSQLFAKRPYDDAAKSVKKSDAEWLKRAEKRKGGSGAVDILREHLEQVFASDTHPFTQTMLEFIDTFLITFSYEDLHESMFTHAVDDVRAFITTMCTTIQSAFAYAGASPAAVQTVHEEVNAMVLTRVYSVLFEVYRLRFHTKDAQFVRKCEALRTLSPAELGIPRKYWCLRKDGADTFTEHDYTTPLHTLAIQHQGVEPPAQAASAIPYHVAIWHMHRIPALHNHGEKLRAFVDAVRNITAYISEHVGESLFIAADDLISLLCYTLIMAGVPMFAEMTFIDDHMDERSKLGEPGSSLANLQIALTYLLQHDAP